MIKDCRKLKIWQLSYKLCLEIHKATKDFPEEEKDALAWQLRKTAVLIPSNIAEGCSRESTAHYLAALKFSYLSLLELKVQLRIARDLKLIKKDIFDRLDRRCDEICEKISVIIKKLEKNINH